MRIYIIHPIEKKRGYYKRIERAEAILSSEGHEIMNPAPKGEKFNNADLFRKYGPKLNACDAVFCMDAWGTSEISNLEFSEAIVLRKTITFEQEMS